ncbi:rhodanese-like domain-containing protein [Paenibacillus contaminans]|uniref:Rhodanese-like domain-containing protein n=1 Tax=Paenibacillus contaminans TaxID=450362 RepID=A0A329M5W8_9BACL|nr:rhodanese-like domain-containing protein [Paenibacillus contaminans]RAV15324.1 rhodanese-like domain-containing protein [Paenibacillus contaminans]
MNTIIYVLIGALLIWFLYTRLAGVKGLRNLTPEQFQQELQADRNRVLIDVREQMEVKQGYIPGAVNIPLSQLKGRLSEIPHDKNVYLYCRSGMRSKQAAKMVLGNGFRELSHLQGGIMAWPGKLAK